MPRSVASDRGSVYFVRRLEAKRGRIAVLAAREERTFASYDAAPPRLWVRSRVRRLLQL